MLSVNGIIRKTIDKNTFFDKSLDMKNMSKQLNRISSYAWFTFFSPERLGAFSFNQMT